ncbi:MAG: hypothetical protein ABR987_06545 [Terracidiphilus sp.]|jgi:hypothetical protein
MKKISPILLGLSIAITGTSLAAAQDAVTMPKVLQITREYTKPYKAGAAHDKTESAFITAFTKAKFPAYYIGLNSLSGKSRALYLTMYDSFAEWEKDNKIVEQNPALAAGLERAGIADGENLDGLDSVVYTRDEDLSYHPHADISHARYMEIEVFKVHPGHDGEFRKAVKMVKEAYDKAGTNAHWAMFEIMFGADRGTFIALSADNSLAEIDANLAAGKKFGDAMGEEGMKKLDGLTAAAMESWHNELFTVNPRQSYVNPDWIKAEPDFWKPKPMAAPAAKPAAAEKKATP